MENNVCNHCHVALATISTSCPSRTQKHNTIVKSCIQCFNSLPSSERGVCPGCAALTNLFTNVTRVFCGNHFKMRLWALYGYEVELPVPPIAADRKLIHFVFSGHSSPMWQYNHITLPTGDRVLFLDFRLSGDEGLFDCNKKTSHAAEHAFIKECCPTGLTVEPLNEPKDFQFMCRRN